VSRLLGTRSWLTVKGLVEQNAAGRNARRSWVGRRRRSKKLNTVIKSNRFVGRTNVSRSATIHCTLTPSRRAVSAPNRIPTSDTSTALTRQACVASSIAAAPRPVAISRADPRGKIPEMPRQQFWGGWDSIACRGIPRIPFFSVGQAHLSVYLPTFYEKNDKLSGFMPGIVAKLRLCMHGQWPM
jgi:hypothetical protein